MDNENTPMQKVSRREAIRYIFGILTPSILLAACGPTGAKPSIPVLNSGGTFISPDLGTQRAVATQSRLSTLSAPDPTHTPAATVNFDPVPVDREQVLKIAQNRPFNGEDLPFQAPFVGENVQIITYNLFRIQIDRTHLKAWRDMFPHPEVHFVLSASGREESTVRSGQYVNEHTIGFNDTVSLHYQFFRTIAQEYYGYYAIPTAPGQTENEAWLQANLAVGNRYGDYCVGAEVRGLKVLGVEDQYYREIDDTLGQVFQITTLSAQNNN